MTAKDWVRLLALAPILLLLMVAATAFMVYDSAGSRKQRQSQGRG